MSNWIITPDKYLSSDEIRQLKRTIAEIAVLGKSKGNQAPVRDVLIISLALNTGLRVSEISNLKVVDVYLKRGQNSLIVRKGKGDKDRIVAFGPKLKSQIVEYLNYRKSDSEYLFPSERGDKLSRSGIQKIFKKIAKKAKLAKHYSIHCLRHTYATQIYKASGFNLRLVQQQLGHASITTTSVYSHVDSEQLEEAISSLEEE